MENRKPTAADRLDSCAVVAGGSSGIRRFERGPIWGGKGPLGLCGSPRVAISAPEALGLAFSGKRVDFGTGNGP